MVGQLLLQQLCTDMVYYSCHVVFFSARPLLHGKSAEGYRETAFNVIRLITIYQCNQNCTISLCYTRRQGHHCKNMEKSQHTDFNKDTTNESVIWLVL